MNYSNYFIEENKSGYKTRESWLKVNNKELYDKIIDFCNDKLNDIPFNEKVWHFINNESDVKRCECGKELKFKKSLKEGYGKYCSVKCTNNSKARLEAIMNTNIERYGVKSTLKVDEVQNKIKQANKEKFGVENIFENKEYIKKKTIEKFGVDHIAKLDSTKMNREKTNIKKYGTKTPLTILKNRNKGFDKKNLIFMSKYESLNVLDVSGDDITINCPNCNNNYTINRSVLYHRFKVTENPCTICLPKKSGVSIQEKELKDFIESLGLNIKTNDRDLIKPFEVDIYIPSKNVAIEYNGLYWHTEKYVDSGYHLNKTIMSNNNNTQMIHIFEDEWLYKKDIVKSRIRNILGFTNERLYARKCEIREVPTKVKTKFLNDNHIQGSVGSKINLGLYYNNELVSIMTFSSLRKVLGLNSEENKYELIRFCNKINTSVIGGASRLLKYFIKTYQPKEIISYADRRWSTGNLYDNLNFSYSHNSPPNYHYVINEQREHRFKYRKDKLIKEGFDKDKSEHEIMLERGIYRIYDCGTITYKKVFN